MDRISFVKPSGLFKLLTSLRDFTFVSVQSMVTSFGLNFFPGGHAHLGDGNFKTPRVKIGVTVKFPLPVCHRCFILRLN